MNWEAVGAIGEIVGAIAVVVTLIYLASQTRLNRQATETNTRALHATARTESSRYWSEEVIRMALSPDMAAIVDQGMVDASALDDNDRQRLVAWYTQHIIAADGAYHQYLDGILPEDAWEARKMVIAGLLTYDSFIRAWEADFFPISPAFDAYLRAQRQAQDEQSWSYDAKARIYDRQSPED